jgi:hypothetical protein
MNTKHAKSPCCGAPVRRFGGRRRQCTQCNGTWRIRPKKRGRRPRRSSPSILERVFVQGFTLAQLAARQGGIGLPTYRHRFRRELQQFVARPGSQVIPRGPLVLLVDGLWFQFKRHPWVLYLMALKPCQGDYAVFLDPVLLAGTEKVARWDQALAAIPQAASERIRAIVVDNLPGMRRLAHQRGWVLQLCHFHLLLKLYGQRGSRPHALYGGPVREQLHQCIRHALSLPEGAPLDTTLRRLHGLALTDCGTARVQGMVRALLRDLEFYRSYLQYPQLGLPHTTNTVESMGRLLRDLFRRSRAGSNPASVLQWATAFIRLRSHITCNSHL